MVLPGCGSFLGNRAKPIIPSKNCKNIYLSVSDIGCEDCFKLIQDILMSIKGVKKVYLEQDPMENNRVVVVYDVDANINEQQIYSRMNEWNFNLEKLEV